MDLACKIRWRMRNDRNPLLVTLQDKYGVRGYAAALDIATPPLLHMTRDPADIPFGRLPPRFIIKANHGCRWNIMGSDGELFHFGDGTGLVGANGTAFDPLEVRRFRLSRAETIEQCRSWLAQTYSHTEWVYSRIPPCILVEEWLEPARAGELLDYRFYTFHGEVKAISVGSPSFRKRRANAFFGPDWQLIPLSRYREALPDTLPAKPSTLPLMLGIARRLGTQVDFARIDLYDTTLGVMLGEVTVYPEAGQKNTPTSCPIFNAWLGRQWRLGWSPTLQLQVTSWLERRREAAVTSGRATRSGPQPSRHR